MLAPDWLGLCSHRNGWKNCQPGLSLPSGPRAGACRSSPASPCVVVAPTSTHTPESTKYACLQRRGPGCNLHIMSWQLCTEPVPARPLVSPRKAASAQDAHALHAGPTHLSLRSSVSAVCFPCQPRAVGVALTRALCSRALQVLSGQEQRSAHARPRQAHQRHRGGRNATRRQLRSQAVQSADTAACAPRAQPL